MQDLIAKTPTSVSKIFKYAFFVIFVDNIISFITLNLEVIKLPTESKEDD